MKIIKMEQTIIAHQPVHFSNISYQIVTTHQNNKKWLNAVNIRLEDKIIENIKLKNTEYKESTALKIAFDFIQKKLTTKKYTTKKQKVNQTAKAKAAFNLMKDLNI